MKSSKAKPTDLKIRKFDEEATDFKDLVASIKENGVLHAIAIKDDLTVIYGNKRARAAQLLGFSEITVNIYEKISDDECKALSLHENLKRHALTWFETAVQEKELHDLRIKQHGQAKPGGTTGWSLRDTAAELNISLGGLSEDIRMADAYLADPSLARISDRKTARTVILRKLKLTAQESLAVSNKTEDVVLCGGSEVILKSFVEGSIDAAITDPPWIDYKDASLTRDEFTLPVFKEVFRVLRNNSFLFMFVGTQDWLYYETELEKIGFKTQKWPLIWVKKAGMSYTNTSWNYQRDYEFIMLAVKGSPSLHSGALSAIKTYNVVNSSKLIHPNEKPIELIKELINDATFENSTILDPFAGSGVLGSAAKATNRRYILIEKNEEFVERINRRLREN